MLAGLGCRSVSTPSVLNYDGVRRGQSDYRYTGSAFAIDATTVLTTSHSLDGEHPTLLAFQRLLSSSEHPGRVVLRDRDIALITLDRPLDAPTFRLAEHGPTVGEAVTIVDGSSPTHERVRATAVFPDSLRIERWYQSLRKGSSGSPVLNARGEIVGMVFADLTVGDRRLVSIYTADDIRCVLSSLSTSVASARPGGSPVATLRPSPR